MSETKRTTEGARKLGEFLAKQPDLTLHAFCEAHGLDYAQIHRLLSGDRGKRVSVDLAEAIERATGGKVPWHTWHSRTLRPVAA